MRPSRTRTTTSGRRCGPPTAKYDPSAAKWTLFDLPTRGTEVRIASLRDLPGDKLEVVVAYPRSSKVAVMTFRSEAEIAALKSQAAR